MTDKINALVQLIASVLADELVKNESFCSIMADRINSNIDIEGMVESNVKMALENKDKAPQVWPEHIVGLDEAIGEYIKNYVTVNVNLDVT